MLNDYSTSTQIANTYATKGSLGTMSSKNADSYYTKTEIDDKKYLTADSEFEYSQDEENPVTMTIAGLVQKVAELEAKIAELTPTV